MTSAILLGMLSTSDLWYSESAILSKQSTLMASFNSVLLVKDWLQSCFFIQIQQFSIGLRSGEFPQLHSHPFFLLGPLFCSHLG